MAVQHVQHDEQGDGDGEVCFVRGAEAWSEAGRTLQCTSYAVWVRDTVAGWAVWVRGSITSASRDRETSIWVREQWERDRRRARRGVRGREWGCVWILSQQRTRCGSGWGRIGGQCRSHGAYVDE